MRIGSLGFHVLPHLVHLNTLMGVPHLGQTPSYEGALNHIPHGSHQTTRSPLLAMDGGCVRNYI